jgi:hypothetical protein
MPAFNFESRPIMSSSLLPAFLVEQIRSKYRKDDLQLDFMTKLRLIATWANGDPIKAAIAGLSQLPDESFVVDSSVLARNFNIKETSLTKNFNLNGYERVSVGAARKLCLLRKRLPVTGAGMGAVEEPNGMAPVVFYHWQEFSADPSRSVEAFCAHFRAKRVSFLSSEILVRFVIESETIDARLFQMIYEHFGPAERILDCLNNFCVSLFSRNWRFGIGDRRVELCDDGMFCFRLGELAVELRNNFHQPNYWYFQGDGGKTDLEAFLERNFPMEIPSELHLVRFIEANFPEALFSADDLDSAAEAEADAISD